MDNLKRNSSFELLRLLAICGVLLGHYNNAGALISNTDGINKLWVVFSSSIFGVAVPVFVLISSYFLCMTQERRLIKVF